MEKILIFLFRLLIYYLIGPIFVLIYNTLLVIWFFNFSYCITLSEYKNSLRIDLLPKHRPNLDISFHYNTPFDELLGKITKTTKKGTIIPLNDADYEFIERIKNTPDKLIVNAVIRNYQLNHNRNQ